MTARCPKCSVTAHVITLSGKDRLANHKRPNETWCAEGSLMPLDRIPADPPPVPDWVFHRPRRRKTP